jgi:hypothetical protein
MDNEAVTRADVVTIIALLNRIVELLEERDEVPESERTDFGYDDDMVIGGCDRYGSLE